MSRGYYATDGHSAIEADTDMVRVASYCSADTYDLRSLIRALRDGGSRYRVVSHMREFVHLQLDVYDDDMGARYGVDWGGGFDFYLSFF
jgi:uncharacterized Rmd1/YagE family protein